MSLDLAPNHIKLRLLTLLSCLKVIQVGSLMWRWVRLTIVLQRTSEKAKLSLEDSRSKKNKKSFLNCYSSTILSAKMIQWNGVKLKIRGLRRPLVTRATALVFLFFTLL